MVTINCYKKENAASMAKAKSGYKFCENGLWGVKSADGVVLMAAKYDQIEICSDYVYAHYGKRRTYFYYNGATSDSPDWDDDYRFYQNGKIGFLNLMVACGLAPSNKQARQLVQQGGILVNDEKMDDPTFAVTEEMLKAGVKIRKGKKVFHKAVLA